MSRLADSTGKVQDRSGGSGARTGIAWDGIFALLLFLALLAFAIRLFQLDSQSIWWDEGISLHLAGSRLAYIIADRLDNIHPPLYFFLLKGWQLLTGPSLFSARFFSLLPSWLLVAALYAVAARWFGRLTGLMAALLATVSAPSVIYAQEVRVYSLLPLAYVGLLAVTRELIVSTSEANSRRWMAWIVLVLLSWTAIHLHYVAVFAVLYVTLWATFVFWRARRWRDLGLLLAAQLLSALASLPWFWPALANWRAISGEANAGTFVTEAVPLQHLLAQVWAFHLTGLAGALARPGVAAASMLTALVLLSLLLLRLWSADTRRATALLLAHWLVPLSSALLVWLVRSFSHPRYVAMFVPGLLLLSSYLILAGVPARARKFGAVASSLLGALLTVLLISLSVWGLLTYFFDAGAAKDDVRGAARYLERITNAGDLILVPDTDWSLPYEYRGAAQVAMPGLESSGAAPWETLALLTQGKERVYTLDYRRGTRDWQGLLPFALHSAGRKVSEVEIDELVVRGYELDQPVTSPDLAGEPASFNGLQWRGAWIEQNAPAGDALAVALEWHAPDQGSAPRAYVSLRLVDEDGRVLSTADDLLLDANGRPADLWPAGTTPTTYHLIPIPAGTPPLGYTLEVGLYDQEDGVVRPRDLLDDQGAPRGQTLFLPEIQTSRPRDTVPVPPLDGSLLTQPVFLGSGLLLLDAAVDQQQVGAGMPLSVQLVWQATERLADIRPRLLLRQDNRVLAADERAPAGGRYPTSAWQAGEQVLERRVLDLPRDAAGQADLVLALNELELSLTDITLAEREQLLDPPSMDTRMDEQFGTIARLAGFSLPDRQFTAGETLPLQLLWQATAPAAAGDLVVFTHLLDADGRLIAQHDGVPQNGVRPFSSWIAGEYILDAHQLAFRDPGYEGLATIEVGIYDPASGQRLLLADGRDHVLLPETLTIVAPEGE